MSTRSSIELATIPSRHPSSIQPDDSVVDIPTGDRASSTFDVEHESTDVDGEQNVSALHPVDRGVHAWRFLAAATLVETTVWGLPFTIGVLHQYWTTELFPGHESTLTLAATLQTGLMYMSTAVLGLLFTAFPRQRQIIQIVGLLVSTVSLIAAGFATQPTHLLVFMGILYPFAGALYLPCATILYEWFQERRGLASGIMYAGTGVGGTVFPFIVSALLSRFGHRASMVALGIGYGVLNAVALVFIKKRLPIPRRTAQGPRTKIDWGVFKTPAFVLGCGVLLFTSLGNFNPTLWIPTFAQTVGARHPDGTALVAIMNAASVPGLTITGWLSDRVQARTTIFVSCAASTLSVLLLWGLGTSSTLLVLFSIVWGITSLSFSAVWSKMISRICKDDPTLPLLVFSMFAVLRGVGNLTSGPISTSLLQTGVFRGANGAFGKTNFGAVLIYTSVTIFAGGCVGLVFPK